MEETLDSLSSLFIWNEPGSGCRTELGQFALTPRQPCAHNRAKGSGSDRMLGVGPVVQLCLAHLARPMLRCTPIQHTTTTTRMSSTRNLVNKQTGRFESAWHSNSIRTHFYRAPCRHNKAPMNAQTLKREWPARQHDITIHCQYSNSIRVRCPERTNE